MDEDTRTLFCGNLSDKITEDILYELFLQAGPIQKICIPKGRDGKQRAYGFVTYKHIHSVDYALHLFDDTLLYNRPISMKLRNSSESQQMNKSSDSICHTNHMMVQLNQDLIMRNFPSQINNAIFNTEFTSPYIDQYGNNDRNNKRIHPYQRDGNGNRNRERDRVRPRERDRNRNRERNYEYPRDERSYTRDNNYRTNNHIRYTNNRKKWN